MMIWLLYDFAFIIFAVISIPKFLVRLNQAENSGTLLLERFGFFSNEKKNKFFGRKVIWLHAVSVGEVMALREWVRTFLENYPDWMLALSTSTPTGQEIAQKMAGERVQVFYAPFDISGVVKRTIKSINPKLILLMETEIWPNLISVAHSNGIPIGIINGRISPRSFKRYCLIRGWIGGILRKLSFCLVQTGQDRDYYVALGMPESKTIETGNMKFDQGSNHRTNVSFERRIGSGNLVFVAGSTNWNEEEILLDVFGEIKKETPSLRLVLVPRHPERLNQVVAAIQKRGFGFQLYSEDKQVPSEVIVIDRMGLLASVYHFADVVFIGGSLVLRGGQNPIEAANAKKPILHGPNVFNFKDVYQKLDENHAAFRVEDKVQLLRQLNLLLRHETVRNEMGERAWNTVQTMKGATRRVMDYLDHFVRTQNPETAFAEKYDIA